MVNASFRGLLSFIQFEGGLWKTEAHCLELVFDLVDVLVQFVLCLFGFVADVRGDCFEIGKVL